MPTVTLLVMLFAAVMLLIATLGLCALAPPPHGTQEPPSGRTRR
jgi:hypothetical protein